MAKPRCFTICHFPFNIRPDFSAACYSPLNEGYPPVCVDLGHTHLFSTGPPATARVPLLIGVEGTV